MVHPNPYGAGYPRSPRDPMNEPDGGYSHERAGQFDGYGQPFGQGPVDAYGRYNPHGPNSYLPYSNATAPTGQNRTNVCAIISLVLGFFTIMSSWWFIVLGAIVAIAGIILGIVGISQCRRGLRNGGMVSSVVGLLLNGCALVVSIIVGCILVLMLTDPGYADYTDSDTDYAVPDSGNGSIFDRPNDRFTEHT